jgi:hypothetical protein
MYSNDRWVRAVVLLLVAMVVVSLIFSAVYVAF